MKRLPTVRSGLVRLVLTCMLPTVAAAALAIAYVYNEERKAFAESLTEAGRALSTVVERELTSQETVLQTLARSPSLGRFDLAAFHVYAREVAPVTDHTIVLTDLQGQQLVNTRQPFGTPLPRSSLHALRERVGPDATLVSDLYMAPIGRRYSVAVQVPVRRDGRVIYYLAMGMFAENLQKTLVGQGLPRGWIGTVVDRTGTVVARTAQSERFVGQHVPDETLRRADAANGAAVRLTSLEGAPMLGALHRWPTHGWGVFIAVPEAQVTSPLRTAATLAAVAAVLLALSLLAAVRLGRRIERPIVGLAGVAEALGRGDRITLPPAEFAETEQVAQAFGNASTSIRSAQERMEERVRQALEEAEKAQRAVIRNQRLEAVGQLTGGVAHDFNNLLMVVGTNAHLLQRLRPELADDTYVARIQRAVATGTKLTRQLLAFSRRQPIRPQRLDLAQQLPELMELVRPTLSSGIEIACEVAPGTPAVLVDPAEFELAIINLAVNARDALAGSGKLRVGARLAVPTAQAPAPMVLVEVSDTGSGIPPEIVDKVFEPFFTTKEVGRGTGLGLSQVYGMATQAGGTVHLHSEPGRGTTVTICLPPAPAAATAEGPTTGTVTRLSGSVLLVEDNPELAEAAHELLRAAGSVVHSARNGEEALALLPTLPRVPDVVLSDIRMPGALDGLKLAARLRETHPALRVVLMTGYTSELEAARAMQLQVIAKPVQPEELLAVLGTPRAAEREAS